MDQTQITNPAEVTTPSVDNDLQKAIDDITNTTSIDPVFSDPVAAPSSIPEGDTGELGEPVGPFPEPKVEAPAPEPVTPVTPVEMPDLAAPTPEPVPEPAPISEPAPAPEPAIESAETTSQNTGDIKKAALRDLMPLLDKVNMDANEKFNLYRDIFEELNDHSVLEPAYQAAREIADETARANALLYLVQSIDKM
jgi:hypothetical protein